MTKLARTRKGPPATPWQLPVIEDADVFAIQAIARGSASAGQQQRAWSYIIGALCQTDVMSFYPGDPRASDFAEGKRWVGIQLRRIDKLRPEGRSSEFA